jgi:transposase
MSQFQLVPYNRIQDHFADQLNVPVSEGSIFNFNNEAFRLLGDFENLAKIQLAASDVAHADETGINIGGRRRWLHCASNDGWTFYYPHEKRGKEAMDDIGILPRFKGILCHDHWKPYYKFNCTHALCNAHHLRELTGAWEQDGRKWALKLQNLLETINQKVNDAEEALKGRKKKESKQPLLFQDQIKKIEEEPGGISGQLSGKPGETVLDQLHQSMLLFGAGRGEALKRFLVEDGVGRNPLYWRLAQSLSALYPAGTDEKRWVDGVLARKKGLGL